MAQHQRRKNAEQVKNRMRARVMNGYWVFQAPWGFTYGKGSGGGKVLIRSEPLASIIKEALEGFASGRFSSQTEMKYFLEAHPEFPTAGKGYVLHERVMQLLAQPLYAGYLEVPKWNIGLRKANHDGLISLETFNRIQDRLAAGARAPTRTELEGAFPLRGHLACGDCGGTMTANWSKGKTQSYPYYLCRQPGCGSRGKSIARNKIEGEFELLLRQLTPAKELFDLVTAVFRDLWDRQAQSANEMRASLKREVSEIDAKIRQLLDRIVEAESATVIGAYERRITELENIKLEKDERSINCMKPKTGLRRNFSNCPKLSRKALDSLEI